MQSVKDAFAGVRPPLKPIPTPLLLCDLENRPGMSAMSVTSAIISRLPEAGINTGVNADGSPNKINALIRIIVEELIKEIKDNGVVTAVLKDGSVVSVGTGANAGGPFTVTSTNTMIARLLGLLQ